MKKYSDDHETLDILNNVLRDFCISNAETYGSEIILNIRSTFKEVADFCNALKSFNIQYNLKKENSPDFENALRIWITEIKREVEIEKAEHKPFNPDNPQILVFSLFAHVYWNTVMVTDDNLYKLHHNLFSSEYPDKHSQSTQKNIYKLSETKLLQIATGYVYAYKLPELEKELIELANEKNINKALQDKNHDGNLIHFKNAAEKYLLLNELGIIDFLSERYPLTSSAKKGLLLAYITDTKKGKPFENILSAVYNKNTESDYYPFKEKNEIKVNQILADIGIERKTKIDAIKKK